MLASDVIKSVRDLLRDDVAPFRWTDDDLVNWISDGQIQIYRRRPDSTYRDDIEVLPPPRVNKPWEGLHITDQFGPALINYVCYRAMSRDSEHAPNAQVASSYYQSYIGELL